MVASLDSSYTDKARNKNSLRINERLVTPSPDKE
jgi:hypothetical protein